MPSKPPVVDWQSDDPAVPIQQGDLLLAAWGKTIELQPGKPIGGYPVVGHRDAMDLRFWDGERPPILAMWGRMNYSLAVVVADDCAIDKEFNILCEQLTAAGVEPEQACERANEAAEPYVAVAEAWPVDALPGHLQGEAASGAVGYVPFRLGSLVPEDTQVYVVDLNRIATISWRSVDRRLGMRDERWRQRLQVQLCRFFAARTIRVNEDLATIFGQPLIGAEALTPLSGNPPRTRARLRFAGGTSVVVEALVANSPVDGDREAGRPGFQDRRGRGRRDTE
jgi:hypothetical protein